MPRPNPRVWGELTLIGAALAFLGIALLAHTSGATPEEATLKGMVALLLVGVLGWAGGHIGSAPAAAVGVPPAQSGGEGSQRSPAGQVNVVVR